MYLVSANFWCSSILLYIHYICVWERMFSIFPLLDVWNFDTSVYPTAGVDSDVMKKEMWTHKVAFAAHDPQIVSEAGTFLCMMVGSSSVLLHSQ